MSELRGFRLLDPEKQREIASKGGKAAHQKGTAHEWTREEAREAGRKGGKASHGRKTGEWRPLEAATPEPPAAEPATGIQPAGEADDS